MSRRGDVSPRSERGEASTPERVDQQTGGAPQQNFEGIQRQNTEFLRGRILVRESQPESPISQQPPRSLEIERWRTLERTRRMPREEQWQVYQTFLAHIEHAAPELRTEAAQYIYEKERERTLERTRRMPLEEQRQVHRTFLAHIPQAFRAEHARLIDNVEIMRNPGLNRSKTREISSDPLVEFATDILMENPDKVFSDNGPSNAHEHELIWAIIGDLKGESYPRYAYLRQEKYQTRYQELREWTLKEFDKWQKEARYAGR
ncbi:hypothetical protein [Dictyobacter arantiisoli]|uniref:Uncharacterized protein n=1 Tax=Dictyobacter arantiisoli TaxID=2014874 RepID=A0A5A5TFD2_9CHLR|nr:hypothetical protein [Dictyobacter arantiisoli]GCF10281.1 hypothetical protein KDI_38450 [Dictyobacter arantiisoli]